MAPDGIKKNLDKKQIITVVALFAVLLAVLYFFVLSGGGEEPADLGPVPVTQPTDTAVVEPGPEPSETVDPGEGLEDPPTNTLRDPFEPPPGAVDAAGNPFAGTEPEVTPVPEESPAPDQTPEPTPSP